MRYPPHTPHPSGEPPAPRNRYSAIVAARIDAQRRYVQPNLMHHDRTPRQAFGDGIVTVACPLCDWAVTGHTGWRLGPMDDLPDMLDAYWGGA